MSSRIIRRGPHHDPSKDPEIHSIQWRQQGQPASQSPAPRVEAALLLLRIRNARPRLGRRRTGKESRQQEAASAQRAQARLEPALAAFNGMLAELAGMRKNLRAEAEEAAVTLALAVARRVLHREIAADPERRSSVW